VPVREDIAKSLASGQSEDQIVVRYVQEYGEKVLSAPTREGFNLLAWWGPYVALVAGGLVLLFTIRRMNREQPGESDRNRTVLPIADSERAQIDRELEDYEP
jgi:cytochrome c-type biogenesis protein CcmH/NrfF